MLGFLNNHRIGQRIIQTVLNNRRTNKHIKLVRHELKHHLLQFRLRHLPMSHADLDIREHLLNGRRAVPNRIDPVMHEVHLPPAPQFQLNRRPDQVIRIRSHHRMNRQPVTRRSLDHRHIAQPQQRHMQRPRNRSGRHRDHIHAVPDLLQALLVLHAEPLLLVNQHQAQILPDHVLREDLVRPANNIDLARFQVLQHHRRLFRVAEPAQHLNPHRELLEPLAQGIVVLETKHRCGCQKRHLFTIAQRLERRAHYHFRLAVPHVAAQQPIHRLRTLHVFLNVRNRCLLVLRLGVLERIFKFSLPIAVRRKREPLGHATLRVELQKLVRHVPHFGLHAGLGLRPRRATHLVQRRPGLPFTAQSRDQVHPRQRDIQLVPARVLHQHVIALRIPLVDHAQPHKLTHAMLRMDNVIARLQVELVSRKCSQMRLPRLDGSFRPLEQILRAKDRQARIHKRGAPVNFTPDQSYSVPARLRPFPQMLRRPLPGQIDLVRHRVLAEHIRQPFHFARGGSKESQPRTSLQQRLGLFDRHLQIAMERHGRTSRNLEALAAHIQLTNFQDSQLRSTFRKLIPGENEILSLHHFNRGRRFQPCKEPLRSSLRLLRFVHNHHRPTVEIQQRTFPWTYRSRQQFPARERTAIHRQMRPIERSPAQRFRQPGQHRSRPLELRQRLQHNFRQLMNRPLRFRVKAANLFNLIAKKLHANRLRLIGREHIQNAAANRVFARHFHRIALLVASAFQVQGQIVQGNFIPDL